MSTWRLQVERARARARSNRLGYIDLDERLARLGVTRKRTVRTSNAGTVTAPSTGRIVRQYETEIRIR